MAIGSFLPICTLTMATAEPRWCALLWERLRDRIAEGAVDLLYVHSPDRLARRYAYQVLLLEEFGRHGVLVVFLNSPRGRSADEEMRVQVQAMFAEYERAKLMERYRRDKPVDA